LHCSWVIAVGIATGLRARGQGSGFDILQAQYTVLQRQDLPLRHTQPLIQWLGVVPSPVVERPGREANYSTPLVARLRMSGAIPPLPPCYILEYNTEQA
jgi:hypothetical protein